jgi:ribosomal protein S18 acetylase RimI-like enzyme
VSYLIFPAGPTDAEALAKVHVASWRETYAGLLPEEFLARMSVAGNAHRFARALTFPAPLDVTLAAAEPGGLVGYACGGASRQRREGEGEIHTLYLLRRAQGAGLGRALVKGIARVLAANGARSLMISVLRDNLKARGFYESLGGVAEPARREPGPGGVLYEVAYVWPDITALTK